MAHPIGLPSEQLPDGSWVGMTPEGIQRVIGQMYMSSGIVPGNRTETRVKGTTGWSYQVPALSAFMWISYASRRGVLVPVEAESIPIPAPTGGASRTDVIYISLAGVVKVATGKTAAPEGVVIDRMVIPAGATNTQGAVSNWDIQYAIPSGASLGRMAFWTDPGGGAAGTAAVRRYTKRFYLPSDRLFRIDLTSTIKAATPTGKGAMGVNVQIDGTWMRSMSCSYDNSWRTYGSTWSSGLSVGAHTVEVFTAWDTGDTYQLATGASATEFSLWDMGADD